MKGHHGDARKHPPLSKIRLLGPASSRSLRYACTRSSYMHKNAPSMSSSRHSRCVAQIVKLGTSRRYGCFHRHSGLVSHHLHQLSASLLDRLRCHLGGHALLHVRRNQCWALVAEGKKQIRSARRCQMPLTLGFHRHVSTSSPEHPTTLDRKLQRFQLSSKVH